MHPALCNVQFEKHRCECTSPRRPQDLNLCRPQDRELLLAHADVPAPSGVSDGGTTGVTPSALGAVADDSEAVTGVSGRTDEVNGAPAPRRPVGPGSSDGAGPRLLKKPY